MPIPTAQSGTPRQLLREEVFVRLRDAIVDGTFLPGEQLRDLHLADWLGVSRTPVREALLRLGEGGLVVARPGRSTVVSELDVKAVRDARDVVAALHRQAVRDAVGHLGEDDLARMHDANQRFRVALTAGDIATAIAADEELHAVPLEIVANDAMLAVLATYTPILRRAERLRFGVGRDRNSVALHDRLIALCLAGDAEAAAGVAFDTWRSLDARS